LDEIEAVKQFENIDHLELRELEIYYLMGKYYQGQNDKMAIEVYLKGIKKYNKFSDLDNAMRDEFVEIAFSLALSLLKLESNQPSPELEKFFKIVRHTYLKKFLAEGVGLNKAIGWPASVSVEQIAEEKTLFSKD
jgi:hypothetical protein